MSVIDAPPEPPITSSPTNVARFGFIMGGSIFLSRVLGMLRNTVLTYRFGVQLDADAYGIAAQLPDMIFMLIAGGGLSSAFIPVFSDFIHKGRQKDAWKVFSVVVTACAIVATVLISIVWYFAPQIVAYLAEGKKDPGVIEPAIVMSRIMLPAQFAFLVGSVLMATLYSRKYFKVPGLAPNVYNVCIILGALFLPLLLPIGVQSMAWGALVGAIIGNLLLPSLAMMRVGSHFKPSLDLRAPGVDKFFKLLLPVVLGFSLPSMVNLITQKFASSYGMTGLNIIMKLSNDLMQAPLGIFGQGLALAVFPVLAEFVATNRMDMYRDQVSRTIRTVLYLGIPSGALMLALAPQIVNVLYGYGKASHDPHNLAAIANCLQIYSVGIFAWCVQPVLMRGFFSLHKTFKPIAIGTLMTVVFIGLCIAATRNSPDFRLLPAATDVSAILLAIFLFFALEGDVGRLDRPRILATMLLSAVASAVAGGLAFLLMTLFHPHHRITELLSLLVCAPVGAVVYFEITRRMKMPETEYIDRAVVRRFRK